MSILTCAQDRRDRIFENIKTSYVVGAGEANTYLAAVAHCTASWEARSRKLQTDFSNEHCANQSSHRRIENELLAVVLLPCTSHITVWEVRNLMHIPLALAFMGV
jgi:hypothetical protein